MNRVLVILSAALCDPELQFLFGRIPAAAVPVGGKKLLQLQVDAAKHHFDSIVVAWPEGYAQPATGADCVEFFVPPKAAKDLYQVLNCLCSLLQAKFHAPDLIVDFVWGDTLVTDFTLNEEPFVRYAVSYTGSTANWDFLQDTRRVFVGHFSVDAQTLREAVSKPFASKAEFLQFLGTLPPSPVHDWQDFGHLSTYFVSKHQHIRKTTRDFNSIVSVGNRVITKRGPRQKIFGELNWFTNLPPELRLYTPKLLTNIREFDGEYSLEYSPLPTLSEMFVHGNLRDEEWLHILNKCLLWIDVSAGSLPVPKSTLKISRELFWRKPLARFDEYPAELAAAYPATKSHIEKCLTAISTPHHSDMYVGLVHGDLCFSNILYDHRLRDIVLIDPRGVDTHGTPTLFGDFRYDLAKLFHSLIGYDHIMADLEPLRNPELERAFLEFCRVRYGVLPQWLTAQTALLFYSMVPLHSDHPDHQVKFIELADRLTGDLK